MEQPLTRPRSQRIASRPPNRASLVSPSSYHGVSSPLPNRTECAPPLSFRKRRSAEAEQRKNVNRRPAKPAQYRGAPVGRRTRAFLHEISSYKRQQQVIIPIIYRYSIHYRANAVCRTPRDAYNSRSHAETASVDNREKGRLGGRPFLRVLGYRRLRSGALPRRYRIMLRAISRASSMPSGFLPPAWAMVGLPPPPPWMAGPMALMMAPALKPAATASSVPLTSF